MQVKLDDLTIEGDGPARDLYRTLFTVRLNSLGRLDEDGRLILASQAVKLEWAEREITRLERDALQETQKRAISRLVEKDEQYLEEAAKIEQRVSQARQELKNVSDEDALLDVLAETAASHLPGLGD